MFLSLFVYLLIYLFIYFSISLSISSFLYFLLYFFLYIDIHICISNGLLFVHSFWRSSSHMIYVFMRIDLICIIIYTSIYIYTHTLSLLSHVRRPSTSPPKASCRRPVVWRSSGVWGTARASPQGSSAGCRRLDGRLKRWGGWDVVGCLWMGCWKLGGG